MIICVSINPAIDRRLRVRDIRIGEVNRAGSAASFAGGKAAHVAMSVNALGEPVVWIGFSGGHSGGELERQLGGLGIQIRPVRTEGQTRINDEIIDESGRITEILEPGNGVSAEEVGRLIDECEKAFSEAKGDFVAVFAGSLQPDVPLDIYSALIALARNHDGRSILDTSGEAFLKAIGSGPDLIKPNSGEALAATGIQSDEEASKISAIRNLQAKGARDVALTLGSSGLVWVGESSDIAIFAESPKVAVNSTVGCGDATVAGFAVAEKRKLGLVDSLRLAVACGTANCLAEIPGKIDATDVERFISLVNLKEVSIDRRNDAVGY